MRVDVLIGQAYFLRFDSALWAAGKPYPPLGALYAAACVRQHGYAVSVFDAMLAESEAEWAASLDRDQPRVAVLFEDSFNYLSKMCLSRMRQAALTMTAAAHARGVPVLVAGSDATDHPDLYLVAGAAAVIAGEGEVTLVHALDALLRDGAPLWSLDGVVVLEGGRPVRTPPRSIIRDLDALPRPALDLIDIERYRHAWTTRHGYFSLNISTTRGCPYHCNWCAKPIYGQRYSARSASAVAAEMAWLKQTYRPDHLWITDDIFGLKPGWLAAFAREVVERDAVIPFRCLMRADGITPEVAATLFDAGCRTVWIGAESGSQHVLDAMEKGTRVAQIEAASAHLAAAGIEVGFFLQFGYPGETLVEIEQTLAMVERCQPDDIGISVSYPLPGTSFHDRVRAELGDKQNWVDSSDLAMMYRATYSPAFYRVLHRLVHARFRRQRAGAAARRIARSPWRSSRRDWLQVAAGAPAAALTPLLAHRLRGLSGESLGQTPPSAASRLIPVLSRRAAALPTEQSQ